MIFVLFLSLPGSYICVYVIKNIAKVDILGDLYFCLFVLYFRNLDFACVT